MDEIKINTIKEKCYEHLTSHIELTRNDFVNKCRGIVISNILEKEAFKDLPHKDYLNLMVVFAVSIKDEEQNVITYLIDNETLDNVGFDVEDLFDFAYTNNEKANPTITSIMNRAVKGTADLVESENSRDGKNKFSSLKLENISNVLSNEKYYIITNTAIDDTSIFENLGGFNIFNNDLLRDICFEYEVESLMIRYIDCNAICAIPILPDFTKNKMDSLVNRIANTPVKNSEGKTYILEQAIEGCINEMYMYSVSKNKVNILTV